MRDSPTDSGTNAVARWVKLLVLAVFAIVLLVVVVLVAGGGEHVPRRHSPGRDTSVPHTPPAGVHTPPEGVHPSP